MKQTLVLLALVLYVCPLNFTCVQIWQTQYEIKKLYEENRLDSVIDLSTNISSISPVSVSLDEETINNLLQPETLIPLIISSVFVVSLITILFWLCTKERSDALIRVIQSVKSIIKT